MLKPVQSILQEYANAVQAADNEAFLALYAEDARIFDAWETWQIYGKAGWRETVAEWFRWAGEDGGYDHPRFEDVQVHAGDTHAFISAFVHYDHFNAQGILSHSLRNRMSLGLLRLDEHWLIRDEHSSVPGRMDQAN